MPRSCVVSGCDRTARKIPGLVFFKFPRDKRLHRAWTKFVQTTKAHFKASQWSLICERHFPEGSLDESAALQKELGFRKSVRAKRGVVPTIKAPSSSSPCPPSSRSGFAVRHGPLQQRGRHRRFLAGPPRPRRVRIGRARHHGLPKRAPCHRPPHQTILPHYWHVKWIHRLRKPTFCPRSSSKTPIFGRNSAWGTSSQTSDYVLCTCTVCTVCSALLPVTSQPRCKHCS